MMGWGLDKEISGSFPDYISLMLGKPRIRLNNLKTSLGFPCLGLNPIIDSINPMDEDNGYATTSVERPNYLATLMSVRRIAISVSLNFQL